MFLHIYSQNAGIIIRCLEDTVEFQMFEACPTNADIMETSGRLLCAYPGPVIRVPRNTVQNTGLTSALADYLAQMMITTFPSTLPISIKAKDGHSEIRDTGNPTFITEVLTGILRGFGEPVSEPNTFQKSIRNDVIYSGHLLAWRRSAFWLVLRVALQTALGDRNLYKNVMLNIMTGILRTAVYAQLDGDALKEMSAKISRRYFKLNQRSAVSMKFMTDIVEGSLSSCHQLLEKRFEQARLTEKSTVPYVFTNLNFTADKYISLKNSREYLTAATSRSLQPSTLSQFRKLEVARLSMSSAYLPHLSFNGKPDFDKLLHLHDFEAWVEKNLEYWLQENLSQSAACGKLKSTMEKYHFQADATYIKSPGNRSIMILTLFELWTALDKITIQHCPLLKQYPPDLHQSLLEPLILSKKSEMKRLTSVESYIKKRHQEASTLPQVLLDNQTSDSFGATFFRSSNQHQVLLARIRDWATTMRQKKREEHTKLTENYQSLIKEAANLSCKYYTAYNEWGDPYQDHSPACHKCSLKERSKNITITVHEWPLPNDVIKEQLAIFELLLPTEFAIWREVTYWLLTDVCGTQPECRDTNVEDSLSEYTELRSFVQHSGNRLSLSSSTKSILRTHYRNVKIPIDVNKVLCNCGLTWQLFDKNRQRWAGMTVKSSTSRVDYTFEVSSVLYQGLKDTVRDTSNTANEIIARQTSCPKDMKLKEWDTFGRMRSGNSIQWLNVATELRAMNLTHQEPDVSILFMNTIWQAGRLGKLCSFTM